AYVAEVLRFQLSLLDVLQHIAALAPEAWPKRTAVGSGRPRPSPAAKLVELSADIVAWLSKPEGKLVPASSEPTTALVWVPAPSEAHRITALDASAKALFEACRGDKTVHELAAGSSQAEATLTHCLADGA